MGLNILTIVQLRKSRELILTNILTCRYEPICRWVNIESIFIDVSCHQENWFIRLWCIIWYRMFHFFIDVRLDMSIFGSDSSTREFIGIANHVWSWEQFRNRVLDFFTLFVNISRHIQRGHINLRCITRNLTLNEFVVVGVNSLFVRTTSGVLVFTNNRTRTNDTTLHWSYFFRSILGHKARDLKFFWKAFRCIIWYFVFNHFVNVRLNCTVFSSFRTSGELIGITNHRWRWNKSFLSILDFSSFFVDITGHVKRRNIHLRGVIWHFSLNQFVNVGLYITAIVGIGCTSELIITNHVWCIDEAFRRILNISSIFGLVTSHFQLRDFHRRCVSRNQAFFDVLTVNVRNFNDFTTYNITRFVIRCLDQLIRCNRNSTTFRCHFRLS